MLCEQGGGQWVAALELPGVSWALRLMAALTQGHQDTACALACVPSLLPLLHALEGVSVGGRCGPLAEALMEEIASAGGAQVTAQVAALRNATRIRLQELSERRRAAALAALGIGPSPLRPPAASTPLNISSAGTAARSNAQDPALALASDAVQASSEGVATTPVPIQRPHVGVEAGSVGDTPAAAGGSGAGDGGGVGTAAAAAAASGHAGGGGLQGGGVLTMSPPPPGSELARMLAQFEEEQEEELACLVCKEGYRNNPDWLLALYSLVKLHPVSEAPGFTPPLHPPQLPALTHVVCTTTHSNAVHCSCHRAARRADANMRQPKTEWEGAALRNGNAPANNLLPLLPLAGPAAGPAASAYPAAVATYFDNVYMHAQPSWANGSSGRRERSALASVDSGLMRVALASADLAMLLRRLAYQLPMPARDANVGLAPALLQVARSAASKVREEDRKVLEDLVRQALQADAQEDAVPFCLALALALLPPGDWQGARISSLRAAAAFATRHSPAAGAAAPSAAAPSHAGMGAGPAPAPTVGAPGTGAAEGRPQDTPENSPGRPGMGGAAGQAGASPNAGAAGSRNAGSDSGGARDAAQQEAQELASVLPMLVYFGMLDRLGSALQQAQEEGQDAEDMLGHCKAAIVGVEVQLRRAGSLLEALAALGVALGEGGSWRQLLQLP